MNAKYDVEQKGVQAILLVEGTMDNESGIKLASLIRKDQAQMPILLQSSDNIGEDIIKELGSKFYS